MLLRSALAALLIVVLTACASSTAALLKIDDILPPVRQGDVIALPVTSVPTAKPGKPQTLLLLGSDHRWADGEDDPPRSDTIMLVRIDPRQDATTVMSIPRDLRVVIPGHGVDKINQAYALGGPKRTLETVKALTGLSVNHVINVNFKGFRRAIDLFDCFYLDVDRRYYHSNKGLGPGQRYDEIDLQPGYQRICGEDALDYVRFRHTDSDLVRSARQQDFLRAAKDQISTSRIIDDLERLGDIAGRATQTDKGLRTKSGFLRLAKLALASADSPVRQVPFPAVFVRDGDVDYVDASPHAIQKAVHDFLHGGGAQPARRAPRARKARRRTLGSVRKARMVEARAAGRALVRQVGRRRVRSLGFPLRFPAYLTASGRYDTAGVPLRIYRIRDRGGRLHAAYRFVVVENRTDGQFYGVQGSTWRNPPLLANPTSVRRVRGRRLLLFRAGSRLRLVAWRTSTSVYWISNTLNLRLNNHEMLALAGILRTARQ